MLTLLPSLTFLLIISFVAIFYLYFFLFGSIKYCRQTRYMVIIITAKLKSLEILPSFYFTWYKGANPTKVYSCKILAGENILKDSWAPKDACCSFFLRYDLVRCTTE